MKKHNTRRRGRSNKKKSNRRTRTKRVGNGEVVYCGIFIDDESKQKLLSLLQHKEEQTRVPVFNYRKCDHVTIGFKRRLQPNEPPIGTKVKFSTDKFGFNDKALAVMVDQIFDDNDVEVILADPHNKPLHCTLSHLGPSDAKESNNITTWHNMRKKYLTGIIGEYNIGTGLNIERKTFVSDVPKHVKPKTNWSVFCDLDGVLANFDAGIAKTFGGKPFDSIDTYLLWKIRSNPKIDFFFNLGWQPGGQELFQNLSKLHSLSILTGVPRGGWAEGQKVRWCQKFLSSCPKPQQHINMFGPNGTHTHMNLAESGPPQGDEALKIITCLSKNKYMESGPGRILIDDRSNLGVDWVKAGGVFIHHTSSEITLKRLAEIGVIF